MPEIFGTCSRHQDKNGRNIPNTVIKEFIETLDMGTKLRSLESSILMTQFQVRLQTTEEIKVIQDKDSQPVRWEDRNVPGFQLIVAILKLRDKHYVFKH